MLSGNRHQARGGPCGELTRRDQFAEFSPIWPVLGRTTEIRRARMPVNVDIGGRRGFGVPLPPNHPRPDGWDAMPGSGVSF